MSDDEFLGDPGPDLDIEAAEAIADPTDLRVGDHLWWGGWPHEVLATDGGEDERKSGPIGTTRRL